MKPIIKNVLLLGLISVLGTTALVYAATNHNPKLKGEGDKVNAIVPEFKEEGESIEILEPSEIKNEENPGDGTTEEKEPYIPFVPEIVDPDAFIDIDSPRDFSKQYDYSSYTLLGKNGNCELEQGVYTSTTTSALYATTDSENSFPYGTYSADIKFNSTDTGLIFGLSSTSASFWEGNGTSYYFAFINKEGFAYLAKSVDGNWKELQVAKIANFDVDGTYRLSVLHRVDRILVFINDVIYVNYRESTPLTGTGWGVRFGGSGASIGNINISSKVTID